MYLCSYLPTIMWGENVIVHYYVIIINLVDYF